LPLASPSPSPTFIPESATPTPTATATATNRRLQDRAGTRAAATCRRGRANVVLDRAGSRPAGRGSRRSRLRPCGGTGQRSATQLRTSAQSYRMVSRRWPWAGKATQICVTSEDFVAGAAMGKVARRLLREAGHTGRVEAPTPRYGGAPAPARSVCAGRWPSARSRSRSRSRGVQHDAIRSRTS
jgi:hypothetical protein